MVALGSLGSPRVSVEETEGALLAAALGIPKARQPKSKSAKRRQGTLFDQGAALRRIFDLLDIDSAGHIGKAELLKRCKGSNEISNFLGLCREELAKDTPVFETVFAGMDRDMDRPISWDEFRSFYFLHHADDMLDKESRAEILEIIKESHNVVRSTGSGTSKSAGADAGAQTVIGFDTNLPGWIVREQRDASATMEPPAVLKLRRHALLVWCIKFIFCEDPDILHKQKAQDALEKRFDARGLTEARFRRKASQSLESHGAQVPLMELSLKASPPASRSSSKTTCGLEAVVAAANDLCPPQLPSPSLLMKRTQRPSLIPMLPDDAGSQNEDSDADTADLFVVKKNVATQTDLAPTTPPRVGTYGGSPEPESPRSLTAIRLPPDSNRKQMRQSLASVDEDILQREVSGAKPKDDSATRSVGGSIRRFGAMMAFSGVQKSNFNTVTSRSAAMRSKTADLASPARWSPSLARGGLTNRSPTMILRGKWSRPMPPREGEKIPVDLSLGVVRNACEDTELQFSDLR